MSSINITKNKINHSFFKNNLFNFLVFDVWEDKHHNLFSTLIETEYWLHEPNQSSTWSINRYEDTSLPLLVLLTLVRLYHSMDLVQVYQLPFPIPFIYCYSLSSYLRHNVLYQLPTFSRIIESWNVRFSFLRCTPSIAFRHDLSHHVSFCTFLNAEVSTTPSSTQRTSAWDLV